MYGKGLNGNIKIKSEMAKETKRGKNQKKHG